MSRRRLVIVIAAAVAALLMVGGTVLVLRLTTPNAREFSDLAQAVTNLKAGHPDPHLTIATDAAHQATVSVSDVIWYDRTGAQYVSKMPSVAEATRLFTDNHFYNFRLDPSTSVLQFLGSLLPLLLLGALAFYLFRVFKSGGLGGIGLGKARAKLVGEHPGVNFSDVAGCDEALTELSEVVTILRDPQRFAGIGARTPRGVLLVGPPGTGKTLIARAIAGEAGVTFFSATGSEFVEMYVGVGAARVRDLFAQARRAGKAIIFIDEIDAVGRHRGSGSGHSNDEREQTLNQLLVEMDGFDNASPIIVIAATNRPDILDKALLRPGRFDRQVVIDLPDIIGRKAILHVHARNRPLADDVDLEVLGRQTPGMSGAELANVLNEGSLLAARAGKTVVGMTELEDAILRVIAGPERVNGLMSERERRIVAHHEMGHALVGHVLPDADPVHKISIVSRGRALGFTMQLPERDRVLHSRGQLTDRLAGLLAGRIAEELVFGEAEVTSGAADDIEKATKMAAQMVTTLGMSPLGLRAFFPADPGQPRTYSEQLATQIDAEVDHLLSEAADRARRVLRDRRPVLDALAARLLEVETMDVYEMAAIIDGFPAMSTPGGSVVPLPRPRRDERGAGPRPVPVEVPHHIPAPAPVVAAMTPSHVSRRFWARRFTAALLRMVGASRHIPS